METKKTTLVPAALSIQIDTLSTFLNDPQFTQVIAGAKDKSLVLFLGITGTGKSTCISYLLGAQLDKVRGVGGKKTAVLSSTQDPNKKFPEIGANPYQSCTLYSEVFNDVEAGITYCDTAGFMDTRKINNAVQICGSLSTELAIQSAQSVKAVIIVLEWGMFDTKTSTDLQELMSILGQFLISPYEDIADSIFFCINKVPMDVDKQDFGEMLDAYQCQLKHMIQETVSAIHKSTLSVSELAKLNRIALVTDLLTSQLNKRPDQVVLMDIFDQGEIRHAIQSRLTHKASSIPPTKFNFNTYDDKRQRLEEELDALASKGLHVMEDYFSVCGDKEELEKNQVNTQANQEYYTAFSRFLKANDALMFSKMKGDLLELTQKEINRLSEEESLYAHKMADLAEKNRGLLQEKTLLDTDERTVIYEDTFQEAVAPTIWDWEVSKLAFRTEKVFVYPLNIPFLTYECTGNGSFVPKREDRNAGRCEVTFTSRFGENASARFQVFAQKRRVPRHHSRLLQIAKEMPRNDEKISAYQAKLIQLKESKKALGDLLNNTQILSFDTHEQAREETEKRFRKHFEAHGLSQEDSRLFLYSDVLPTPLEKGALYLLKTKNEAGHIFLTAHVLDESPKHLSEETSQMLYHLKDFPVFPTSAKKPVAIRRTEFPALFHRVTALCGYVVADIADQKKQLHQKRDQLKAKIRTLHQTMAHHQAEFAFIETLSRLLTPATNRSVFLARYQGYKKAVAQEMVSYQRCIEQAIEGVNQLTWNDIFKNTPESLETLENWQAIIPVDTEPYQKVCAFLSVCRAHQSPNRHTDMINAFEQCLSLTHPNSPACESMTKQVHSFIFIQIYTNTLSETTLNQMVTTFIARFGTQVTDDKGNTLLHAAVSIGHVGLVRLLLKQGAWVTLKNNAGETPFFLAAKGKHYAFVTILLKHSPIALGESHLTNATNEHLFYLLLEAAIVQGERMTPALLEAIETVCQCGATFPLSLHKPTFSVVHTLVSTLKIAQGLFGDTALFGDPLDTDSHMCKLLTLLLQNLTPAEKQQCLFICDEKQTVLQLILTRYSHPAILKAILSRFIPLHAPMDHEILAVCIEAQQVELCEFLLKQWHPSSIDVNRLLRSQKTLLRLAISTSNPKLVALLLTFKADPQQAYPCLDRVADDTHPPPIPITESAIQFPLQQAVVENHIDIVILLLKATPKGGWRHPAIALAFLTAAQQGNQEALIVFNDNIPFAEKASLWLSTDKQSHTALHLTIKQGHVACTQWLFSVCAEEGKRRHEGLAFLERVLNKADKTHETPLITVIKQHNTDLMPLFFSTYPINVWQQEQGQQALNAALSDRNMPTTIVETLRTAKLSQCLLLIKTQLTAAFFQDTFHQPFLPTWMARLEKVMTEVDYANYREKLMSAPMHALQRMTEHLSIYIVQTIRDKYRTKEDKQLLQSQQQENTYHMWDQLLRNTIDKTLALFEGHTVLQKMPLPHPIPKPVVKDDKHRAFTRALKDALRDYFYISRALYEGKILMNDEGFNTFKSLFNMASPVATEIGTSLSIFNIGIGATLVIAALELITKLKEAKYQCEAGRFVEAFGLCQPDAIEKCEKDIPLDHDKLKAVAETLYHRYRDQIQQCTVSKEAEISIRLAKTDGIYVLAHVMADRIFQHMIKKRSVQVEDDRTITTQIVDWIKTIGADNDIYQELSLISLPERCVLAVLYECVGDDKDRHVHTDVWLKNGCKTEDIWMSGGILVKTGLKLERNPSELYIREGIKAQQSLHEKYGYCYVSESLVNLKEIENREFIKASSVQLDVFADKVSEADKSALSGCFMQ